MDMFRLLALLISVGLLGVSCGSDDATPAKIEVLTCKYTYNLEECTGFESLFAKCELSVKVVNNGGETAKNVTVKMDIPNVFGAVVYTKDLTIGDVAAGQTETATKITWYDFSNMAVAQCSASWN